MRMLLVLFLLVPAWAQEPAQPAKPQRRPPPEPKNLKVLKVPPAEIIPIMRSFTVALGVQCTHCHVQNDVPSDANPKKEVARTMISMAQHVNSMLGEGKMRVTCYT